jgi:tetratricopeptide (TPR) repeat protein
MRTVFMPRTSALFLFILAARTGAQTPAGDLTRCGDTNADTSISACTEIIDAKGQADSTERDTLAKAFTYRGFSYFKKNQADRAIEDFTQAIRLDANNAWAFANRGNAYFNKHQYELALKDYDQALTLNPVGYPTLFYGRGAIYNAQGEPAKAIEQFDEAIRQQPDFPEAFNNRGIAFFNNAQFGRAVDDYTQALHLRPDYLSPLQNRGNAYAAKGQYDQAIEDYGKAIELRPAPAAFRNRGNAYRAKGDYEKALADLNASIHLAASTGALDDRGLTYLEMGQTARAFEDFSEAIRAQADDPDAFQSKGQAEFYLGKWNDAVADLQKSQALDASNAYAFIWLHLASVRGGKDDGRSLEQQADQVQAEGWPGPIVDLFLGKLKPAYAIAFASDPDPDKSASQHCEAEFYVGEYLLTQGDSAAATPHLEEARAICSGIAAESLAAKMELKRTTGDSQ